MLLPGEQDFAAGSHDSFDANSLVMVTLRQATRSPVPGDKPAFYVGIIHLIQQSDYAYWLVAKFMQPTILNLMGIPAEVYAKFTSLQKRMAQEMLDTMHPMTERYPGTTNDGEMIQREAVSTNNVSAPTLILHAKDDALVSYHHAAEHAHEAIKHSRLISFDTGGHGLLPRGPDARAHHPAWIRLRPCSLLQHPARLYRQVIQRHLQFRNGLAEFWMLSDLLLQGLQNLVSTCNMRCCLG